MNTKTLLTRVSSIVLLAISYTTIASAEIEVEGEIIYLIGFIDDEVTTADPEAVRDDGGLPNKLSGEWARGYSLTSYGSEIRIKSTHKLDNGFRYGGRIDIATELRTTTNEAYVFIENDKFGKLFIGHTPVDGLSAGGGGFGSIIVGGNGPAGPNYISAGYTRPQGADGNRVVYHTPDIYGFKGGLSYSIASQEEYGDTDLESERTTFGAIFEESVRSDLSFHLADLLTSDTSAPDQENAIGFGLSYRGDIGALSYRIGGSGLLYDLKAGERFKAHDGSIINVGETMGRQIGYRFGGVFSLYNFSIAGALPVSNIGSLYHRFDNTPIASILAYSEDRSNLLEVGKGTLSLYESGFDAGIAYDFKYGALSGSFVRNVRHEYFDKTEDPNDYLGTEDENVDRKFDTIKDSWSIDVQFYVASGLAVGGGYMRLYTSYDDHKTAAKSDGIANTKSQLLLGAILRF